jgi:predicted NBD/HSP70 family sugar kinase
MQSPRAGARRRRADPAVPAGKEAGRTAPQIADHNLRVTLEAIRREGPLTRLELARRTGLTAPGITNILRRLGSDGLVTARRRSDGGSGQPAIEFALNPEGAFAIGLRIGEADGEAVLIDLSGRIRERLPVGLGPDPATAIGRAVERLRRGLPAGGKLLGVGVGARATEALELDGVRTAVAPLPVLVERDCATAVLAERMLGVGAIEGGLMLIIIDEGVRCGFLFQGVPFRGVHGRAGGLGAMRTGVDHVPLDTVAGLAALRAVLSPEERRRLAEAGVLELTPGVRGWIKNAAGHLLDAIVATAGFVAPGAILIGGDLPRNVVEALIAQLPVERRDTAIRPFATPWIPPVRPASFPGAGIALGAALLPLIELLLPSPMAAA